MLLVGRFALSCFPAAMLLGVLSTNAQSREAVQRSARVSAAIDSSQTVRLSGHRPGWAIEANDQGALDGSKQLTDIHLILARSPAVEAAFQQLLVDQQNPASPRYHQWLTPQQNADQYGIAATDLAAVTAWLQSRGLHVDDVAAGGVLLTFSGPVSAVQSAFSTSMHNYLHEGESRYAPASEPAIPAGLAGVVQSVAGLAEEVRYVHSHRVPVQGGTYHPEAGQYSPFATSSSGNHLLSPGDFNLIYDVNAARNAGYTGTGFRVVILIDSTVVASDISSYETLFGISAGQPTTIVLSTNPGVTASEGEADLDLQRVIGTAPGAGVDLLVLPSLTDANIFSGLQYEISTLNDAVVNMSFGGCNTTASGSGEAAQYSSYYQAATAQGISLFNSSGDSGAAGCDTSGKAAPSTQVLATNILCMSPYITCVGGTQFADTASPSTYWSSSNSSTLVSALSYIPEGGWNEPTQTSGGVTSYVVSATGGGSGYLAKPSWQTGTGVPADGLRDMPDVSFTASDHNGFLICEADISNNCATTSFQYVIGGTSASSPSMAGVAAMLDQKLGTRQGNLNPLLYQLAASASSPFHDATVASSGVAGCAVTTPSICNNSTPGPSSLTGGLSGYLLTTGYDEVTGLGSLDVANFLAAAAGVSSFSVAPAQGTLSTAISTPTTDQITLNSLNGFTGTVTLSCAVVSTGGATGTCGFSTSTVTLTSGGTASTVLTVTPGSAAGTLNVVITATSGSVVQYANIAVTVGATTSPTFSITPASNSLTFTSGATSGNTVSLALASLNNFAGNVALVCTLTSSSATYQPTCSVSPSSVALAANGTGSATVTISSTTARSAAAVAPLRASNWTLGGSGAALAVLLFCTPLRKRRRIFAGLTVLLATAMGSALITGCSSSGTVTIPTTQSSAGTYTVTITGTGTSSGTMTAVSSTAKVTVAIN